MVIQTFFKAKPLMDNMERAKINIERQRLGLPPLQTWQEELEEKWENFKSRVCRRFCGCCYCDWYWKKCLKLKCCRVGTIQNYIVKTVGGFFLGALLTIMWFFMMVYQMKHPLLVATITTALLGTILTLGMAFFPGVRCMVFLTLPTLFSSKGRSILLGYAFVLVMLHPMENFNHNILVMSESSTCGQEMAYNETKEIVDMAMAPVKTILHELRELIKTMVKFAEKLRKAFRELKDLAKEVLGSIEKAFGWLGDMVNICNEKMGAPYRKCKDKFEEAKRKCKAKMSIMGFLCEIVTAVSYVCHVARIGELFCHITRSIKNFVVSKIRVNVMGPVHNMYKMFYFNVTLNYHYEVTLEQSKSYTEVKKDIMGEIEARVSSLNIMGNFTYLGLVIAMTLLISKAYLYRHKFLTKDSFDNHYISEYLSTIDERRDEMNKEKIMPLRKREKRKYVQTKSLKLGKNEMFKFAKGLMLFLGTFLQGVFFMSCDLGLYWVLSTVRRLGRWKAGLENPGSIKIYVQGEGILANIYRTVVNQFDPSDREAIEFDTAPCLPNPTPPNYGVYKTILSIYVIAVILLLTQAYGLRLRHVIAGYYYPERKKERAVWLYNHILSKRGGGFLIHLRREMRKEHKAMVEPGKERIGLAARLAARSKLAAKLLKFAGWKQTSCLCCGSSGKQNDEEKFVFCPNLGCSSAYCKECFTEINNMCTVCMKPVDYGDYSDYSEELDSSDPEPLVVQTANGPTTQKKKMIKIPERLLDYTYQYKDKAMTSSSESEEERPGKVKDRACLDDLYDSSSSSSSDSD